MQVLRAKHDNLRFVGEQAYQKRRGKVHDDDCRYCQNNADRIIDSYNFPQTGHITDSPILNCMYSRPAENAKENDSENEIYLVCCSYCGECIFSYLSDHNCVSKVERYGYDLLDYHRNSDNRKFPVKLSVYIFQAV